MLICGIFVILLCWFVLCPIVVALCLSLLFFAFFVCLCLFVVVVYVFVVVCVFFHLLFFCGCCRSHCDWFLCLVSGFYPQKFCHVSLCSCFSAGFTVCLSGVTLCL